MKKTNFKKILLSTLVLTMIGGSVVMPAVTSHKVSALTMEEVRQNIDPLLDAQYAAEQVLHDAKHDLQSLLDDNARAASNGNLNQLNAELAKLNAELSNLKSTGAPMQEQINKLGEVQKIQHQIDAATPKHTPAEIADAQQKVAAAQAKLTAALKIVDDWREKNIPPVRGWLTSSDDSGHSRWYFYNHDGNLREDKDWVNYGNYWMFSTGSNGYLTNEWAYIKKSNSTNAKAWFYFDNDGKAVKSGWKNISYKPGYSRWYKFSNYNYDKGSKWVKSGTRWMYIDGNNGYLTLESKVISGKTYNFNNNGYCTNP